MKKIILTILWASCVFSPSSAQASRPTSYLVISQHPHDLAQIQEHTHKLFESGRLMLVSEKVLGKTPASVLKNLRPVVPGEVLQSSFYSPKKGAPETKLRLSIEQYKKLAELDLTRFKKNLLALTSLPTRLTNSENNRQATDWLQAYLTQLGYTTSKNCFTATACNVVGDLVGTRDPQKIILVQGHLDSVGAFKAGADDNASGAAGVLEMAHVFAGMKLPFTLRFMLTNGEEQGMVGSGNYVNKLGDAGVLKNILLAINMDMIAFNANGVVELETNAPFETVAKYFAALAVKYTKLKPKITLGAWGSDHVPYLKKNISSILTIEDWSTKTPCYHKACDLPESLNYDYAVEVLKMNVAAVLAWQT